MQSAPVSDNPPGVSLNLLCSYTLSSPASPPPAHTACATAMYHMPHRARRLVSLLPHLYGLEGLLYGNPLQRRRAACIQQHLRGHATESC